MSDEIKQLKRSNAALEHRVGAIEIALGQFSGSLVAASACADNPECRKCCMSLSDYQVGECKDANCPCGMN